MFNLQWMQGIQTLWFSTQCCSHETTHCWRKGKMVNVCLTSLTDSGFIIVARTNMSAWLIGFLFSRLMCKTWQNRWTTSTLNWRKIFAQYRELSKTWRWEETKRCLCLKTKRVTNRLPRTSVKNQRQNQNLERLFKKIKGSKTLLHEEHVS